MGSVVIGGQRPLAGFGRGQLCQMHAAMATRRGAIRVKTPSVARPPWRSRSSWPLRASLADRATWRFSERVSRRCRQSLAWGATEAIVPLAVTAEDRAQAGQALLTLLARESDPEMARQNLVGEATRELEHLREGTTLCGPSVSRKYSAGMSPRGEFACRFGTYVTRLTVWARRPAGIAAGGGMGWAGGCCGSRAQTYHRDCGRVVVDRGPAR
jgi:hypothetical protein